MTLQYQGQHLKWYHFVKNIFINSLRSPCNVFWSHSFPLFPAPLWEFGPISQEGKAVFRIPAILSFSDLANPPQLRFCFNWITEYNLCYTYTSGYRVIHRGMDDLPETTLIKKDVSLSIKSLQLTEAPQGWGQGELVKRYPLHCYNVYGLILGRPCTDNCIHWVTWFLMSLF